MLRNNSPYTSAFTACSFMYSEFNAVLPLLKSENSGVLLKEEIANRNYIKVNNEVSAKRIVTEFIRRYSAVPIFGTGMILWMNLLNGRLFCM